jgi:hypothetical protein
VQPGAERRGDALQRVEPGAMAVGLHSHVVGGVHAGCCRGLEDAHPGREPARPGPRPEPPRSDGQALRCQAIAGITRRQEALARHVNQASGRAGEHQGLPLGIRHCEEHRLGEAQLAQLEPVVRSRPEPALEDAAARLHPGCGQLEPAGQVPELVGCAFPLLRLAVRLFDHRRCPLRPVPLRLSLQRVGQAGQALHRQQLRATSMVKLDHRGAGRTGPRGRSASRASSRLRWSNLTIDLQAALDLEGVRSTELVRGPSQQAAAQPAACYRGERPAPLVR